MLNLISQEDAARIRAFFEQAAYTQENLLKEAYYRELPSSRLRNVPRLLLLTEENTPINILARMFLIGTTVPRIQFREHVPDHVSEILLRSGLVTAFETYFRANVRLAYAENLLIVSDPSTRYETGDAYDLVLWPNPTTRLLANCTIRRRSRATFDLGTGNGVQALLAGEHSERVLASDVNERAIEFARFSAALNGIKNIDFVAGDAFQPAKGRRFDLIVSNPPFFLSPSREFLFCNSGMELDSFCRELVRRAPEFLNEGGFLQILFEWAEIEGENWWHRIERWFEGSGCDVWLAKTSSKDWLDYAQDRLRETPYESEEEDQTRFADWASYYQRHRLKAVHGGILAMRKRSGLNWSHVETLSGTAAPGFGQRILRTFATRDLLESPNADAHLLASPISLDGEAVLDQQLRQIDGEWRPERLSLTVNMSPAIELQALVAEFLASLDGRRTLGERVEELATRTGEPRERVMMECLSIVRRLLELDYIRLEGL